jgi:sugar phosphate isomerase/epimerase
VREGLDVTLRERSGTDLGGKVRLADNRGDKEEHLFPGKGTIDFRQMLDQIEGAGYRGHYLLAFGSTLDMRAGRDVLLRMAGRA